MFISLIGFNHDALLLFELWVDVHKSIDLRNGRFMCVINVMFHNK